MPFFVHALFSLKTQTPCCEINILFFSNRAKDSYRQRNWAEVRRWCGKVIGISDDWNAVEQAHLRLALAEQKLSGAEGGRRAFQVKKGRGHDKIFRRAVLRFTYSSSSNSCHCRRMAVFHSRSVHKCCSPRTCVSIVQRSLYTPYAVG